MNGDKCEWPCQIVCGSRCFWTFCIFGLATAQTVMSSRQSGEADGAFLAHYYDMFCLRFSQDGRPEDDITYKCQKRQTRGVWLPPGQQEKFFLDKSIFIRRNIKDGLFNTGAAAFAYSSPFQLAPYFISEIPPCGFCQPENTSDEGVLVCLILPPLPDRCWHLSRKP